MRLAAIDVGTNTVLLLVADVVGGRLEVVADQERFARLGQGVDATGVLAPEAIGRTMLRLRECRDVAEGFGAERIIVGGTSASRDAANIDELVERANNELGLEYEVLSGEDEAAMSFEGAVSMLDERPEQAVVIDVGGGSTEIAAGRAGSVPAHVSIDMGSVRLTERIIGALPASIDAARRAQHEVDNCLAAMPDELARTRPVVAAAGTARVAAALAGRPGTGVVATEDLRKWRDRLMAQSAEETLALDPALMSGRADVAAAGLLILVAALDRFGADEFLATPGGLRHGLVLRAGRGRR